MKVRIQLLFLFVIGIIVTSGVFAQETDVSLLKEKILQLQNFNPLGIRTLVACSKVTDYGSYEPLPDNRVKAGDVIFFYFEPQNPSTNKTGDKYEIWLSEDMMVFSEKQQEVFKKENTLDIHYKTSVPRLDIYGVNQLTLTAISPGKYQFQMILYDKIKGERATATWAFEVVP
ncbi:MAG: hypothetical protein A2Z19_05770 [Deltaproteobacteria bacterium RBG_16_54_18]|nr:MAG: hypothetical protein A2Z19_05770 [Deltaproteobacteria bacterium RBG_16_54_18]